MPALSAFKRLVRFEDSERQVYFGEVPVEVPVSSDLIGLSVPVYEGSAPWDSSFHLGPSKKTIAKVLSPVPDVPIFLGVGLNYRQHAIEASFPIPTYPVIFTKPSTSLAGPYEDIPIDKEVKSLDYEGELCVVIGKDCKNLSPSENPLDYVLGYTVGNDVSSRWWQQPTQSGNQHGYAKSFDKFAPIGPILCSPAVIPDPSLLKLITRVNGAQRQTTGLDDLIFDIPTIIRHLSRGRTLQKGSVIMTGTPSGVGAFMTPPTWLEDGDVVEIEISEIGKIRNVMKYDK